MTPSPRIGSILLVLAITVCCVDLYLQAARTQNAVNNNLERSDQGAYINFAIKAYETQLQFTGNRNQMPLYPHVQALFYSPTMDDEAFFEHGKQLNVILSLACLLVIGSALFIKFSKLYAFYALLVIAFLAFAIKAPFFQAEILFYTLFGFAFILSLNTLFAPKWYKSIGVGVLFALAHFSKASAMPGLFLFISSYGILFLLKLFSRRLNRECALQILYSALAPLMVFMLLLLPYFQESKDRYGSYFYNINTTFYIWYDSWAEAINGTKAAGDQEGWPDLPDEEIPSLGKYLEEHSVEEIINRFAHGATELIALGCTEGRRYTFGYCSQVGLSLIILAFSLPIVFESVPAQSRVRHIHIIWYLLVFFGVYALSFSWQVPIMGKGPRGILSLLFPLLWVIGLVVHSPQVQALQFNALHRRIKVFHIVYLLLMLTLFYEIHMVVAFRAAARYGGK